MSQPTAWGDLNGQPIHRATITSPSGALTAHIITQGAAIQDLVVRTASGPRSVILGFDDFSGYAANSRMHHGAVAGRVANRIAHSKFELDGHEYTIPANEPSGHVCHGGQVGFGRKVWTFVDAGKHGDRVTLELKSPDGDEGFPGTLTARLTYSVHDSEGKEGGAIRLAYEATTDKATPVNLTNHAYFNLDGTRGSDVLSTLKHQLLIEADEYTPVDAGLIPTGKLESVTGTPLDFRQSRNIETADPDSKDGKPYHYDLNYVLRGYSGPGKGLHRAARAVGSKGDLVMETWTDQPGVQLFDGAPLNIAEPGLGGAKYVTRTGFCLETQVYPDAIHHKNFPETVLRPEETYSHLTEYRFELA